jgi:ABC-2 type transport system ATP-binding protein
MDKEILISVEHLTRYYNDYCAVDNASFTVDRGEVLGFLGPNGAGKTTTMQILSGVLAPTAGSVAIAGINIQDQPKAAKAKLGYLPEQPPLYTDLTVDEYLHYAARLRGIQRHAIDNALNSCKQRCGLDKVGQRLIKNLSRGYQQRVGIAQAIIHSPAVVILDEPTSGLDPIQILEIRNLVKTLGKDHSVILSTHILPEVQALCSRVLIINEGKLVLDRDLDQIQDNRQNTLLQVAFRQPPSAETLQSIHGIKRAEKIDAHRYLLETEADTDSVDLLLQSAMSSCWGLTELVPRSNSLEQLFVQLTSGSNVSTTGNNHE